VKSNPSGEGPQHFSLGDDLRTKGRDKVCKRRERPTKAKMEKS